MLKLDIGCGGKGSRWPGFIGIDLHPRPQHRSGDEYLQGSVSRFGLMRTAMQATAHQRIPRHCSGNSKPLLRPRLTPIRF